MWGEGPEDFSGITWISGGDGGGVSRHTNEVGGGEREGGDLRNITWPYGGIR